MLITNHSNRMAKTRHAWTAQRAAPPFNSNVRGLLFMLCPDCKTHGISALSGFNACAINPAKCKFCGGFFTTSGWVSLARIVFLQFGVFGAGLASYIYHSMYPILLFSLAYILLEIGMNKWFPLKKISEKQRLSNRKYFYIFFIIFGSIIFVMLILRWV